MQAARGPTYDVVVVGYGGAGACVAIAAADAGASVLLVEKSRHLGGLTLLSSGFMRAADDAEAAAAYLERTNGGRVRRALVDALAQGMTELPELVAEFAGRAKASCSVAFRDQQGPHQTSDLYGWPGREALGWVGIDQVEDFDGYPWATRTRGHLLMRTLELNVSVRDIDVWLASPARRLINGGGGVRGVVVDRGGWESIQVGARGGVVLATGGFEFDEQMRQDFFELPTSYAIGHPENTGDGIKMAQDAGAALWHMWHFHGSYGFKVPGFDIAFRNHLGGARRKQRAVAWILVDQHGQRFMNEVPPAPQDTAARPLDALDAETGGFDRVPCWMVFDEATRKLGPVARPVWTVPENRYEWSEDNSREVELGWVVRGNSPEELAQAMGVPGDELRATIEEWNRTGPTGDDPFGRPPGTAPPLKEPPFYALQAWPICTNTQGGPRHDELQRVLDAWDDPIPGLYAVGELGSFFGHIYLLGGNLSEGAVGGRIAGRHATERALS